MASSKQFRDFVLDQLRNLRVLDCKPMMGEFLLYYKGVLFGGIYDDRLLVKITNTNKKYNLVEGIPYKNAKPMFTIENLDDMEYLCEIVRDTCKDLQNNK